MENIKMLAKVVTNLIATKIENHDTKVKIIMNLNNELNTSFNKLQKLVAKTSQTRLMAYR